MTTMTQTTTQVYQVFIRATSEEIWEAITKPEFTAKYFYGAQIEITPERRRSWSPDRSESWGDGAVLEYDRPRRLVHEWRSLYDPELAAEGTEPRHLGDRGSGGRVREAGGRTRSARGRAEDGRQRLRRGLDDGAERPEDAPRDGRAAHLVRPVAA